MGPFPIRAEHGRKRTSPAAHETVAVRRPGIHAFPVAADAVTAGLFRRRDPLRPPAPMPTPTPPAADPPTPLPADGLDDLFAVVYDELRRIARQQLAVETAGHTLSPTALVHEAYLRLAGQSPGRWSDRAHFLAVAAQAMRRVLVDHARRHRAAKRGGGVRRLTLDEATIAVEQQADLLLALDAALDRLGALEARLCRVVECRFFAGLTEQETAEALRVTDRTVRRDWVKARGWLLRELGT